MMALCRPTRPAVAAAFGLILCLGCDSDRPASPLRTTDRPTVRITLVGEAKSDPTWPMLVAAAQRFETYYPYAKLEVIAPDRPSPNQQQSLLEGLLEAKTNAICVIPIEAPAVRSVIDRLVKAGRPVVTIGRDCPSSRRAVYCGPTESAIGRSAAAACRFALPEGTNTVMVLHAGDGHEAYRGRYYAFKETLPTEGNIRILRQVDCQANPLQAVRRVRAQSRLFPRVGCWVMLEDWPLRMLRPKERLLPLGCGMVLCNGSPKYFDRMKDGEIQAMVAFDYYDALENGLRAALRLASASAPESASIISTPTEIITARRLAAYRHRWDAWQHGVPSPPQTLP